MSRIILTDEFWKSKTDLIRNEVIPYQWEALNDRIAGAEKSYCIRNFKLAAKILANKNNGEDVPCFSTDKWQYTPENTNPNAFLGWVFQDSDLYKWLEAVAYSLETKPDRELEARADYAIELICAAQEDDGYLDTLYTINNIAERFSNLRDFHELYCFGHLAEAAAAYYSATKKDRLLKAACRFADLICDLFGEGGKEGYGGHEIAEMALVKLFEQTGEEKYLKQAELFINRRGTRPYYFDTERNEKDNGGLRYIYNQAHIPVREQNTAVGHSVRAVYLYCGMADTARLRNDFELLETCKRLFENITQRQMYITGGIGATNDGEAFTFDYDLPNDLAYAESCASIGLAFFAQRLFLADKDSKYADIIERCLYNGILSGISLDGKSFFYTNPLEVFPKALKLDSRKFHIKSTRQKWFGCACCPPNIARIVSNYGNYCILEEEGTLFVNLYQSLKAECSFGEISIESDYLESGRVVLKINPKSAFTLALRIPYWSDSFEFSISNPFIKKGYAYFEIDKECELTAEFNPEIKLIKANNNVRADIGKIAVMRGPFVYCLEEADNGSSLHLLRLSEHPKLKYDGEKITASGYREEPDQGALYYEYKEPKEHMQQLTFIPYFKWANRGENEMTVYIRYRK